MSITIVEREDSRQMNRTVNSAKEKLHFLGGGSTDQNAMFAAALLYSPLIFDGYFRQEMDVKPLGAGLWDIWVDYGFSAESQGEVEDKEEHDDTTVLGPEFDFDITAQTAHITQSLKTIRSISASGDGLRATWTPFTIYSVGNEVVYNGNRYICSTAGTSGGTFTAGTVGWDPQGADTALDPAAPNYGQAIGVAGGQVAGTDVYTGHMEFGVTVQVYPIQLPYLRTLLNAVGTTNLSAWFNFPAGTLLYLGATGTCKPGSLWTLHHKFAAAPNITNIPIGPSIIVPMKRGWEYLWCTYRDQASSAGLMVQVPAAAYVEQVYRESDYAALALGS